METEKKLSAYEFLSARLDDVAPERYPPHSVRIICAAAIEEFANIKSQESQSTIKQLQDALGKANKFIKGLADSIDCSEPYYETLQYKIRVYQDAMEQNEKLRYTNTVLAEGYYRQDYEVKELIEALEGMIKAVKFTNVDHKMPETIAIAESTLSKVKR